MDIKQALERGKAKNNIFMLKRDAWEKTAKYSKDIYIEPIYYRNGELYKHDYCGPDMNYEKAELSVEDLTASDWSYTETNWVSE